MLSNRHTLKTFIIFLIVLSAISVTSLSDAYAETSSSGTVTPLVYGTGGLIDKHHLVQAKELKANWRGGAELKGGNSFGVGFESFYLSDNPKSAKYYASSGEILEEIIPDMRPVTSVVFIQMEAVYKDQYGDFSYQQLTKVIPVLAIHVSDREINAVYDGTYEMPTGKANEELYAISIKASWLRVFQDNNGSWYYQWIEGSNDALDLSNAFKPHETWTTGDLVVYYPIPERLASPESLGFDYVKWIKEQTQGSFGFEKTLVGLSRFAHPPSMLADSDGSLHVIWSADEQYEKLAMRAPIYTQGLWYAKVKADGSIAVPPTKLARGSYSNGQSAVLNDKVHIVWSDARDYNEVNGTFNIVLYYMQLDKDGKVLISERQLSNAAKQPESPLIAADGDGNLHIVWKDSRDIYQRIVGTRPGCVEESGFRLWNFELYKEEGCEIIETGGALEIYYKKLDQYGNTIIDDKRITSMESIGHSIWYPVKLLVDGSNILHLFRMDLVNPSDYYSRQIYYTALDLNGDRIVQDKPVTEIYDYDVWFTDVQLDSDGNFYLAGMAQNEKRFNTVSYLIKVSKDLDAIYEKPIFSDREFVDAGWPNIAIDQDNNAHLVWTETWTSGGKTPADYTQGAYYMKINQEGKVLLAPTVFSDGGGYMDIVVRESQVYVLSEVGLTGVTITAVPGKGLEWVAYPAVNSCKYLELVTVEPSIPSIFDERTNNWITLSQWISQFGEFYKTATDEEDMNLKGRFHTRTIWRVDGSTDIIFNTLRAFNSLSRELTRSEPSIFLIQGHCITAEGKQFGVETWTTYEIKEMNFSQEEKKISYIVDDQNTRQGLFDVIIPQQLMSGEFTLMIDGRAHSLAETSVNSNGTHSFIDYRHEGPAKNIDFIGTEVIPEFPFELIVLGTSITALTTVFRLYRPLHRCRD